MSNTDTDPAAIELQRRQLLAGQPPEPTSAEMTTADSGVLRSQPKALAPKQNLSTDLSFSPVPRLRQYDAPVPQKDQFSSTLDVFKDPMIVLAGLSSLFTRRPLVSAMNYAAGAMKGFHQGQADVFEQNKTKFDEAIKATIAQNQVELTRYNAAWDRKKEFDWQKVAPDLIKQASQANDQLMLTAIKSGNWELVSKIIEGRERAQERLQEAQALAGIRGGPQSIALHRFLDEHPDATAEEINSFIQGGRAGRSALTMYMQRYLAEHPGATADEVKGAAQQYTTETTAQNRFLSGPQGNTVRSLNVVVSHLETMRGLADALRNNNVQRFNQLAQRFAEETGQPAPTNFDTAKQIVGTEIIKALGVAGAGTENERKEAADGFMRARSPDQIYGAIGVVQALLGGQLKGLRRQFTTSTGLPGERFDEMLEPETVRSLGNTQAGPVRVKTPEEAQKLAPGTRYLTPDGHEYVR